MEFHLAPKVFHSPLVTSDLALSPDLSHPCPARGGAELASDAAQDESYLVCAQDFARKLLEIKIKFANCTLQIASTRMFTGDS
jgi:hypothetical protein